MSPKYYQIVETSEYKSSIESIVDVDDKTLDKIMSAAFWFLARAPSYGRKRNPELNVWSIPITEFSNLSLILYYTFDADSVFLLSLEHSPDYSRDELVDFEE